MTYSFTQAITYVKSDMIRYGLSPTNFALIKAVTVGPNAFKFSFWMRMCGCRNMLFLFNRMMYSYYRDKYTLQIPYITRIGYGLYLGHGVNIIINETATIGNNCNLSQNVTIGSNHNQAATIGNNVYIGPNVCIIENVQIGNYATIGAGAIVVKDVLENSTVAGNPAKLISTKNPGRYIGNKYNLPQ